MTPSSTVLIVGAGAGLGASLTRRFSNAGCVVAIAGRRQAELAALAEGSGERVHPYACDATKEPDVEALFTSVESDLGQLQVVVHNVGVFSRQSILEASTDEVEKAWRAACFSGFLVGRAAARAMTPRGKGTIIFTGATGSKRGSAMLQNSAMAKAGVRALSQSMARELGPRGIHVAHVVIDGRIRRAGQSDVDDESLGPDEIAEVYYELFLQRRSAWTHEFDLRPWKESF